MFCRNCGSALSDDAKFCVNCGQSVNNPAEPAAPPTQEPVQSQQPPYPPIYQQPMQPVDSGSWGWFVLGLFFPLVGLILFLAWRQDKPLSAKRAGIGALVGVIVSVLFSIIFSDVFSYLISDMVDFTDYDNYSNYDGWSSNWNYYADHAEKLYSHIRLWLH